MVRYITIAFAFTLLGAALGYLASHAELDAAYKAKRANFDLQNKCALQAEKAVRQSKHENDDVAKKIGISNLVPGVLWSNYQSHYSPMLNKCFVVQEDHRENFGISKYLYDAYEQRIYAAYSWTPVADKSSGEAPTFCQLTPTSRETNYCKSDEEWEAFVALYMEQ